MRPESIALCNELLQQHQRVCITGNELTGECIIAYGELCRNAGVSHILRSIGQFLLEVAEWCAHNNMPPINAFAVNAENCMPGESYDVAPSCSLLNWADEVRMCIAYRDYPEAYIRA